MIKLTLTNGVTHDFHNKDETMEGEGMLKSLFNAKCSAREGDPNTDCTEDYIMLNSKIPANYREAYVPIVKAEWNFAENPFEHYVQNWMTERKIEGVFKFLNGKYPARFGALFLPLERKEHAILTLVKYSDDIESIIDEMADGMGLDFYYVFYHYERVNGNLKIGASKFKLETLPLIAFEETVRRAIQDLQIGW